MQLVCVCVCVCVCVWVCVYVCVWGGGSFVLWLGDETDKNKTQKAISFSKWHAWSLTDIPAPARGSKREWPKYGWITPQCTEQTMESERPGYFSTVGPNSTVRLRVFSA